MYFWKCSTNQEKTMPEEIITPENFKEVSMDTLEQLRDLSKLSPSFLPEKYALLILKNKDLQEKIKTKLQKSKHKADLKALLALVEEEEIELKKVLEKHEAHIDKAMQSSDAKKSNYQGHEKKFREFEQILKKMDRL
jgi:hypothetical protein